MIIENVVEKVLNSLGPMLLLIVFFGVMGIIHSVVSGHLKKRKESKEECLKTLPVKPKTFMRKVGDRLRRLFKKP